MQQLLHFKIANLLGQSGKAWVEEMQQREEKMLTMHQEVHRDIVSTQPLHHVEQHIIYVDPAKKDTDTYKLHEVEENIKHENIYHALAVI